MKNVIVDDLYTKDGYVKAKIFNFDVNSYELKPEHYEFLKSWIAPFLYQKDAACWMRGTTSSTGSPSYNMKLAKQRVLAASNELLIAGIWPNQIQTESAGETFATILPAENKYDRAVEIIVQPGAPRSIPTPKKIPPKRPAKFSYKMRMDRDYSIGIPKTRFLGKSVSLFTIWDPKSNLASAYTMTTLGAGVSLLPLEITGSGPWNDIHVSKKLGVDEFSCGLTIKSSGAGSVSYVEITMESLPRSAKTIPHVIRFATGTTVGAGYSGKSGTLELMPDPFTKATVYRYNGTGGFTPIRP